MNLARWAEKWGVPHEALAELHEDMGLLGSPGTAPMNDKSEAYVQSLVRLEAAQKGVRLFRNNTGVLEDRNGRPVRFGLCNDSSELNKVIKSSDLIGFRPVRITAAMVGTLIAQIVARECKKPDWHYVGSDREQAQVRFLNLIASAGGDAAFVTGAGSL